MTDLTGLPNLVPGDVLEPYSGALIIDYEAEATVSKGDSVYLSSDGKVSPATSAQLCVGVATKDAAVGQKCPVITRGRVKVKVGGATTRGHGVYGADASKRVLDFADPDLGGTGSWAYARCFGYAEQSASAADDLISVLVVK
jgi:hypothetical protein